jgi:hypothetical protein
VTTHSQPTPPADVPPDQVPAYTASGRPVTRGERVAFQIWVVCVLFTLVVTLVLFLIDKFRG